VGDQPYDTQVHGTAMPAAAQPTVFTPAPKQAPRRMERMQRDGSYVAVGRRKTAIARVRVKPGDGKIVINDVSLEKYFALNDDRVNVTKPLDLLGARNQYDLKIKVAGGGTSGQSAAILLGVARALSVINKEWIPKLREQGFLTRDAREVERKKYGRKKARRRFQFSKR
jgi:small subunit ribosomal protein S9